MNIKEPRHKSPGNTSAVLLGTSGFFCYTLHLIALFDRHGKNSQLLRSKNIQHRHKDS